jgi:AcrR family transcriptional regulator
MRADQDGVTDAERMTGPSAQDGVLHHHHTGSDHDRTTVSVQDRAVQHARIRADGHVTGDDSGGGYPRSRINVGHAMRLEHPTSGDHTLAVASTPREGPGTDTVETRPGLEDAPMAPNAAPRTRAANAIRTGRAGSRYRPPTVQRSGTSDTRSARQRLLDAADRLFYAEGVLTVGIDRIIEQAAVAKASLYNIFGSKEALVRAYLESRHVSTTTRLGAALAEVDDPREKLLAVFDVQRQLFADPGFRGCAFVSAGAEAAPGGVIENAADDHRAWIRSMFVDLATRAGAADPHRLARQLQLLYDGAGLAARTDRDPTIATCARDAAATLLATAVRSTSGRTRS